jgi:flagellar basal-body rod modification protein FlgD
MIHPAAIFPQASAPAGTGSTTGSTPSNGLPSSQSLNNMFLQLLVAQLQNQDPTSPMDPTQFVSQLAQFSELSEVTEIEQMMQQSVSGSSTSSSATLAPGAATISSSPNTSVSVPASTSPAPLVPPLSNAASAAQSAIPNSLPPAASFLQHRIEGVF